MSYFTDSVWDVVLDIVLYGAGEILCWMVTFGRHRPEFRGSGDFHRSAWSLFLGLAFWGGLAGLIYFLL